MERDDDLAAERRKLVIFVTGPLFAGKQEYICGVLGWSEQDFRERGVRDVQELACGAADPAQLADDLCRYDVVIATETGAGVVPADPEERRARENAGRLACLLAERADTVVRVVCGLPQLLKGEIRCIS